MGGIPSEQTAHEYRFWGIATRLFHAGMPLSKTEQSSCVHANNTRITKNASLLLLQEPDQRAFVNTTQQGNSLFPQIRRARTLLRLPVRTTHRVPP